jgi:epoxyqueuosine reductase QueG
MNISNQSFISELMARGAALVGFGNLSALQPAETHDGLPVGVCVAVKYPKDVIRGISELPTLEYFEWYNKLNEKLDELVTFGAELIISHGWRAAAYSREYLGTVSSGGGASESGLKLPHKTVATRAAIGWIGKCALLVNKEYGSMIRLSSIMTDAPFECAEPIDASQCGGCTACVDACPAKAVSGKQWRAGLARDEFFDAAACGATARARSKQSFGGTVTICGKCIETCPHTRAYLDS